MKDQKRNESLELVLALEHRELDALSSSIVTEADFMCTGDELFISLSSESFSDLRARWNSIMRALIASEQSLEATSGGAKH